MRGPAGRRTTARSIAGGDVGILLLGAVWLPIAAKSAIDPGLGRDRAMGARGTNVLRTVVQDEKTMTFRMKGIAPLIDSF
jgi:hypothetical protein